MRFFKLASWMIILLGIVLRLRTYFFNRSLWADEAMISLNIIEKSFKELFCTLDYNQGAPIGFLLIEKLLVGFFGNNEYVLRAYPLFCGILSIFLFSALAKKYLEPIPFQIALLLFSVLDPLIYYSSETKQYSSDVAIVLLLLLLATNYTDKSTTRGVIVLCFVGAFSIWLSFPAVFILLGLGTSFLFLAFIKKENLAIFNSFACMLFWVLSFLVLYKVHISSLDAVQINHFLPRLFMPMPINFSWLIGLMHHIFYFMGLHQNIIPVTLFCIGIPYIFFKDKKQFVILTSSIPFVLIISAFHFYPLYHRLLLFLIPLVLICISSGFEIITKFFKTKFPFIEIFLILVLFFTPFQTAKESFINPISPGEIKSALDYIRDHKKNEDLLYIYHAAQYQFKYYVKRFRFNNELILDKDQYNSNSNTNRRYQRSGFNTIILGTTSTKNDGGKYTEDLKRLCGNKRVWILISHLWHSDADFLKTLDGVGVRLFSFEKQGAAAYLYDFGNCKL